MFFVYSYIVFFPSDMMVINCSPKIAFVFMHIEKQNRKYKKINLVTVQYQKVKLTIQWKKTRILQVKYKSIKYLE